MTIAEQLEKILLLVRGGYYVSYKELRLENREPNGYIKHTNIMTFYSANTDKESRKLIPGDVIKLDKLELDPLKYGPRHFQYDDEEDLVNSSLLYEIRIYFSVMREPLEGGGWQEHHWNKQSYKPSWLREQPYGRGLPDDEQ